MASNNKDKPVELSYVSCKGRAHYPHVNEPDTKFKDEGEYNVRLFMPMDGKVKCGDEEMAMEDFEAKLEAEFVAAYEDAKASLSPKDRQNPKKLKEATRPFGRETPMDDDGTPTGPEEFYISAKMKASGTSRRTGKEFTMRPTIFDAPPKPAKPKDITSTCPSIGNGSILKISGSIARFFNGGNAGVTIRLNNVQVFEIRSSAARDAASAGFDGAEDGEGYEHDPSQAASSSGKPGKGREHVDMDDNDDGPADGADPEPQD